MEPFDSTIQEQVKQFQQRLAHRERLYREAIAALAVEQMMQQSERRAPEPPRRRPRLRLPCRVLVRGVWQIISLALGKQRKGSEMRPQSASVTEPTVIDVVYVDPDPPRQPDR